MKVVQFRQMSRFATVMRDGRTQLFVGGVNTRLSVELGDEEILINHFTYDYMIPVTACQSQNRSCHCKNVVLYSNLVLQNQSFHYDVSIMRQTKYIYSTEERCSQIIITENTTLTELSRSVFTIDYTDTHCNSKFLGS